MKTIPLNPVTSSNVKAIGYSPEKRILVVEFKSGHKYAYHEVSKDSHDRLMKADSLGSHLSRHIVKTHKVVSHL